MKQAESTPETVAKKVCWTVSAGVSASVGAELADGESIGAEVGAALSVESCSKWTEVPGGYTVYL